MRSIVDVLVGRKTGLARIVRMRVVDVLVGRKTGLARIVRMRVTTGTLTVTIIRHSFVRSIVDVHVGMVTCHTPRNAGKGVQVLRSQHCPIRPVVHQHVLEMVVPAVAIRGFLRPELWILPFIAEHLSLRYSAPNTTRILRLLPIELNSINGWQTTIMIAMDAYGLMKFVLRYLQTSHK
jgi:hypothetical protein